MFEFWPRPSASPFARTGVTDDGEVLGAGACYAISPRYVEIAAYADPIGEGLQLIASAADEFLGSVFEAGYWIASTILVDNDSARRFAAGAGWDVVAEQKVIGFAEPAAGSGRAWPRSSGR